MHWVTLKVHSLAFVLAEQLHSGHIPSLVTLGHVVLAIEQSEQLHDMGMESVVLGQRVVVLFLVVLSVQLQGSGRMFVLFSHRLTFTSGTRPSTKKVGVIVTLGEVWIWNGSWFEPTVVPPVMRSTACWAVTLVVGSICARLLRFDIWNVTAK